MTPTDADRARAYKVWKEHVLWSTNEYAILQLADYIAQARAEGEEVILNLIRKEHNDPNNGIECYVTAEFGACALCDVIRAVPMGEEL